MLDDEHGFIGFEFAPLRRDPAARRRTRRAACRTKTCRIRQSQHGEVELGDWAAGHEPVAGYAERLALTQPRAVRRELEVEAHDDRRRGLRRQRVDHVAVRHHQVGPHEEARAERAPGRRLDATHREFGLTQPGTPLGDVGEPGAKDALLELRVVWRGGGELHALGELPQRRVLRPCVASLDDRPLEVDQLRVAGHLGASAIDQRREAPLRLGPRDQSEDDIVQRTLAGDDGEVLVEMELDEAFEGSRTRKGVPQRGVQRLLLTTVECVHVAFRRTASAACWRCCPRAADAADSPRSDW